MQLWPFHGGVKPNEYKKLSCEQAICRAPLPPRLYLPLLQHIGEPTEAIVNTGEQVLKGQVVARCRSNNCDFMSAPIHASSSGTVVGIENRDVPHLSRLSAPCIVIETDGEDAWTALMPLPHYRSLSPAEVRQHIAQAGIVGLGGAGFPSHLKLKPQGVELLILNGAECEPYITCDDRLMRECPQNILGGAEVLSHVLGGAKHCLIAIEDNKPEAYASMCAALKAFSPDSNMTIEVVQVPSIYPMGGERQLIQVLTRLEIGKAKLPSEFGIVMHNVETANAVYRAVLEGRPLISRVVTVTGDSVAQPQNIEVAFGTPMGFLLDHCQRRHGEMQYLIMGGSMMGLSLPHDDMPVVKTTNCLIANHQLTPTAPPMPCIRCGACADSCPINLLPQQLYWHARAKDFAKAEEQHLFDCIDCGCCAYVCPSHIPLVDYFRYAKSAIRAAKIERQRADIARERHDFRTKRLEREKAERAARHKQKRDMPVKPRNAADEENKQAVIAAAVARAEAKRTQQAVDEKE